MSTRSVIVVHGKAQYSNEVFRLYKHSDGYPTANLDILAGALERAVKLVSDFNESNPRFKKDSISSDVLTGLIIGEATSVYGMGAVLEGRFGGDLELKHFGDQGDLEWIYVVDVANKQVRVYGGHYGGSEMVTKGTVDPLSYAEQLKKDYQGIERQNIRDAVKRIEATGFNVN